MIIFDIIMIIGLFELTVFVFRLILGVIYPKPKISKYAVLIKVAHIISTLAALIALIILILNYYNIWTIK